MQISHGIQLLKKKTVRMSLALVNTDLRKIGFSNKSVVFLVFFPCGIISLVHKDAFRFGLS